MHNKKKKEEIMNEKKFFLITKSQAQSLRPYISPFGIMSLTYSVNEVDSACPTCLNPMLPTALACMEAASVLTPLRQNQNLAWLLFTSPCVPVQPPC